MKKKQLIAFASAMALAVTSLAGCGKSEGSTPGNRNGSSWRFSEPECQASGRNGL